MNDIDEDMDLLGAVFCDETCRKAANIRVYITVGGKKNEAKMFKFKSVFFGDTTSLNLYEFARGISQ